ncbi:TolB family protein [Lysobacter antibioticus]|uniref:TolB family protein n=1 Tax=Lysobacter antibioticus TaxID=84531 RepID=UPI0004D01139|nr:PD40 domain-containing protein [Lysobacter antibioticus]
MRRLSRLSIALAALAAVALPAAAADACPPVRKFADGVISTPQWEWRLSFTPSRQRAYWSTSKGWWPGTRERATVMTSQWRPSGWSAPQAAPFSGVHSDMDPALSPDGRYLVFSSERPRPDGVAAKMDLWIAKRGLRGWGEPRHLGAAVNSAGDELYPSTDRHGHVYFASDRDGEFDIYRSERLRNGDYAPARKVEGGVNTAERWEFNPEISPDGRILLFTRLDFPNDPLPDLGYGYGDLHAARLKDGRFGTAKNLGPCVNTVWDEFHPTVLWDRGLLFYARDIGRPSDFYYTRLQLPDLED